VEDQYAATACVVAETQMEDQFPIDDACEKELRAYKLAV
jgi:hypothetical protein